ncbi:ABC transporter ATP-binding protein [Neptunomonas phycophila]|nr:ABC transporter ATP-binding protein [Neptunomonas phycophila]
MSVSYGQRTVLSSISCMFPDNAITALIGPNGCGKSTLLKAALGLVPKSHGSARYQGENIDSLSRKDIAARIAYLPQESYCPEYMLLGDLIEMASFARQSMLRGPSKHDRCLFHSALKTVGLESEAHRRLSTLSGGQKQRAWIALVLAQDAHCILLDEPVNHLDVHFQYSILTLLKTLSRHGKMIITVLHDLNLAASFADHVMLLKEGVILGVGPTASTLTPEKIKRVFDIDADVFLRNQRLICLPQLQAIHA